MKISKILISFSILISVACLFFFQNCARSHFVDPDPKFSAMMRLQCRTCHDESGTGLKCADTNAACDYESCASGFQMSEKTCIPVTCLAGAVASCQVLHGEGRATCQSNQLAYGACLAISCEAGFKLQEGGCVAVPIATCAASSHRDCSTDSTYGSETCNEQGSGYEACIFNSCKPGFNKDQSNNCVPNICDPVAITPCTAGVGAGFQTCNSQGSGWGACALNGCQSGYNLIDGVCVTRLCTPNEQSVCLFDHGTGLKICNNDGTNYGSCSLVSCETGFSIVDGQCIQQKCTPAAATTCQAEGGSGLKYCYQNGQGFGPCGVTTCDVGFKLKNSLCVSEDSCETGETFACTGQNGSGFRNCKDNHKIGPCVMTKCNSGFELVNQGGSPACKNISNGNNK